MFKPTEPVKLKNPGMHITVHTGTSLRGSTRNSSDSYCEPNLHSAITEQPMRYYPPHIRESGNLVSLTKHFQKWCFSLGKFNYVLSFKHLKFFEFDYNSH